jgi:hypothetical protein
LLLSTRKLIAHAGVALRQAREELVYSAKSPILAVTADRRRQQILAHGKVWENLSPFRDQANAALCDLV